MKKYLKKQNAAKITKEVEVLSFLLEGLRALIKGARADLRKPAKVWVKKLRVEIKAIKSRSK